MKISLTQKGAATRAEVATVLRRFVEIVIDPQVANGWQQNDSGKWNYYRNVGNMLRWPSCIPWLHRGKAPAANAANQPEHLPLQALSG